MGVDLTEKQYKHLGREDVIALLSEHGIDRNSLENLIPKGYKPPKKRRKAPDKLKTEQVKIMMTKDEVAKMKSYAEMKGITVSQLMREYVRRLPAVDTV